MLIRDVADRSRRADGWVQMIRQGASKSHPRGNVLGESDSIVKNKYGPEVLDGINGAQGAS